MARKYIELYSICKYYQERQDYCRQSFVFVFHKLVLCVRRVCVRLYLTHCTIYRLIDAAQIIFFSSKRGNEYNVRLMERWIYLFCNSKLINFQIDTKVNANLYIYVLILLFGMLTKVHIYWLIAIYTHIPWADQVIFVFVQMLLKMINLFSMQGSHDVGCRILQ